MGFTPNEFYEMSVWEFAAVVDGWNKAHGDGKPQPPDADEFERAVAISDSRMLH